MKTKDEIMEKFDVVQDKIQEEVKEYTSKVKEEVTESKLKILEVIKKGFEAFQKFGLYMLLFTVLGIYIGISTSRMYYTNKISDIVKVGAFLFQEKVYQITIK